MTPDELRALADRCEPWPFPMPIEMYDLAPSLAREVADLREWAAKAAGVLRAMLSTLGDYATVEEMNETRFADLRGYMMVAETDLLETLLAEWDAMKERP